MPSHLRFTDYPFRLPSLTNKQIENIQQRNRAIKIFRETGDPDLPEEIGLFWNKDDEKRARAAQELRFTDDPSVKLTDEQKAERFGPIIERRRKETIKEMVSLFKPIETPIRFTEV